MRFGYVSLINEDKRTIRVTFADRERETSGELVVIKNGTGWFPDIGQLVVCLFTSNGEGDGIVIGTLR